MRSICSVLVVEVLLGWVFQVRSGQQLRLRESDLILLKDVVVGRRQS
jgi:hypothetical protein